VVNDRGRVLAYEPYRRVAYGWHVEIHEVFRREKPSRVTFAIEPIGREVKLTVTHDEFEPRQRGTRGGQQWLGGGVGQSQEPARDRAGTGDDKPTGHATRQEGCGRLGDR
jgi:hypothetical protein